MPNKCLKTDAFPQINMDPEIFVITICEEQLIIHRKLSTLLQIKLRALKQNKRDFDTEPEIEKKKPDLELKRVVGARANLPHIAVSMTSGCFSLLKSQTNTHK